MKTVSHLICAFAALQLSRVVCGATVDAVILTNPAAPSLQAEAELVNPAAHVSAAEAEFFQSIVPGADAAVTPSAFDAAGSCDTCCDCGSGCCGDPCKSDGCDCGDGCNCGSGVAGWFGVGGGANKWTARLGGVVLNRSQPVPSIIAEQIAGVANLRATDFSIGTTVGVDLTLARQFTEAGSLEARYLGALEWDPRASLNVPANINLGGNNLFGITAIGGGYNSTLHSTEFNWRHQRSERFSWLAGFRWIELEDTVDFFVSQGGPTTSLSWNTNNHMYGGQIGADYMFWQSTRRPITVSGSAKGGIFGNDADSDFSQFIGPVQIANGGAFGSETSFVTDLALTATYRINDRWSARAGAQFLYIDGVALGSDHVAASLLQGDPNLLDTNGYVYYTGGLLSLDRVW